MERIAYNQKADEVTPVYGYTYCLT